MRNCITVRRLQMALRMADGATDRTSEALADRVISGWWPSCDCTLFHPAVINELGMNYESKTGYDQLGRFRQGCEPGHRQARTTAAPGNAVDTRSTGQNGRIGSHKLFVLSTRELIQFLADSENIPVDFPKRRKPVLTAERKQALAERMNAQRNGAVV